LETLANAFKESRTFKTIFLRYDGIDDRGAIALGKLLRVNESISSINLTFNRISDVGAMAIADALGENKTLTSLDLRWNDIDTDGIAALQEASAASSTLKEMLLEGNVGNTGGAVSKRESKGKSMRSLVGIKSMRVDKGTPLVLDVGVAVGDIVEIPGYVALVMMMMTSDVYCWCVLTTIYRPT
jgi:hypothetical protein